MKKEEGNDLLLGKACDASALVSRSGRVLIRLREAGGREAAKPRTIV